MQSWGKEFSRWALFIAITMLFIWGAKTPTLENIPLIGNFFKWVARLFSASTM